MPAYGFTSNDARTIVIFCDFSMALIAAPAVARIDSVLPLAASFSSVGIAVRSPFLPS